MTRTWYPAWYVLLNVWCNKKRALGKPAGDCTYFASLGVQTGRVP
jgi:hypothetical protein